MTERDTGVITDFAFRDVGLVVWSVALPWRCGWGLCDPWYGDPHGEFQPCLAGVINPSGPSPESAPAWSCPMRRADLMPPRVCWGSHTRCRCDVDWASPVRRRTLCEESRGQPLPLAAWPCSAPVSDLRWGTGLAPPVMGRRTQPLGPVRRHLLPCILGWSGYTRFCWMNAVICSRACCATSVERSRSTPSPSPSKIVTSICPPALRYCMMNWSRSGRGCAAS